MPRLYSPVALLLLCIVLNAAAEGQSIFGSVRGTVLDQSGLVIPGAPTAIFPWLSFTTSGEMASAARGLVDTARELRGNSMMSLVTFESVSVAFSVLMVTAVAFTSS